MANRKFNKVLLPILALAALLIMTPEVEAESHKRNEPKPQTSVKDRSKTRAQWKAHPEKGWVRANEDHDDSRNGQKENSKQSSDNRQKSGSKKN